MTVLKEPSELLTRVGQDLGTSSWLTVDQDRIDKFAEVTQDRQWIHVDVARATAGPFGGPIAHGHLTLSLVVPLWTEILTIENVGMAVNYGLNKVRFPAPVPAGSRIRLSATLAQAEQLSDGCIQIVVNAVVHVEGKEKPAIVAELVHRYYSA